MPGRPEDRLKAAVDAVVRRREAVRKASEEIARERGGEQTAIPVAERRVERVR